MSCLAFKDICLLVALCFVGVECVVLLVLCLLVWISDNDLS